MVYVFEMSQDWQMSTPFPHWCFLFTNVLDHERMVHASSQPPIMAEEYHDEDQDEAQYILSCLLWSFQLLISFYVVILFSLCSCVGLQFVVK